jgi:AcrR family transcriptional regulator
MIARDLQPPKQLRQRRRNDPEGLRDRVVNAAFHAFTTRGYHAVSVHDLREAASVSGGAYAHHFPTKKALALLVIERQVLEAVRKAWIEPVMSARTAATGIAGAIAAIIAELEEKQAVMGCPLNNLALELAGGDKDFQAALRSIFAAWRKALADKMRADVAGGNARYVDPDAAAAFVVAAYSGAMALAKATQSVEPLKLCTKQLVVYLKAVAQNGSA